MSVATEEGHMDHTSIRKHRLPSTSNRTSDRRGHAVTRRGRGHVQANGHALPDAHSRARRDGQKADVSVGMASVLKAALFALVCTAGIGLILLLLMTGIVLSTADPDTMVTPMALAALGVSSLAGGMIAARLCGGRALLCGLCVGILWTFVLWLLTFFIDGSDPAMTLGISAGWRVALHAAVIGIGGIGGRIGGR